MIGVSAHVIVLVVGYAASLFFPPGGRGDWTLWGWLEKRKTLAKQLSRLYENVPLRTH
jgi:hypothetical protein